MFRTVILSVILCLVSSVGLADIKKPETLLETLQIMKAHVEAQDKRFRADIDLEDGSLKVTLDSEGAFTSYPDNLHKKLLQDVSDATRQEVLEQHMRSTIASVLQPESEVELNKADLPNIMPVYRHRDYETLSKDAGATLVSGETMGDMVLLYVIDTPDSVSYISTETVEISDLQIEDVKKAALDNLNALRAQVIDLEYQIYKLKFDGFYEASFLLDTKLWSDLYEKHGELYVIAPNRDNILFTSRADLENIDFLTGYKKHLRLEGIYPLSEFSYIWNGTSWEVAK